MTVVQQKFKLQQQIEAWQVCIQNVSKWFKVYRLACYKAWAASYHWYYYKHMTVLFIHFLHSQSDMAQVVEKQVIKQLKKDRMKKALPSPSAGKSPERRSHSNSWLFGSSRTDV